MGAGASLAGGRGSHAGRFAPLARTSPVALGQRPPEERGQFLVTDPLGVRDVALERRSVGHALLGEPRQLGVRLLVVSRRRGRGGVSGPRLA